MSRNKIEVDRVRRAMGSTGSQVWDHACALDGHPLPSSDILLACAIRMLAEENAELRKRLEVLEDKP